MRLYLLRHGRTPSNQILALDTAYPGADLDALGVAQAARMAETLSARQPAAVYASNLLRAQQTAAPLAELLGVEVAVRDGLREIEAGDDEMSTEKDAYRRYLNTTARWLDGDLSAAMPGGCNGEEFLERFDRVVAEAGQHESAVLTAHGAAIRTWLKLRVTDPQGEYFAWAPYLGNTDWVEVEGSPDEGWRFVDWHTWEPLTEPPA